MAEATEKAPAKEKEKKERKEAPVARVRSRGQISRALEQYAETYRMRYPDRDVRYVYDPTHKPELSGVLGRQAMGYEIVTYGELGLTGKQEEDRVRVGDLVLMSIDKKTKKELVEERTAAARDQTRQVERKFYEEIEKAANDGTPKHHSGPATRPLGRAVIEEKEFQYERKQREE